MFERSSLNVCAHDKSFSMSAQGLIQLKQSTLRGLNLRKFFSSQDFGYATLINSKMRRDLMIKELFLLLQKPDFGGHLRSYRGRGLALHRVFRS
jgi:hypothetical protein